MSANNAPRVLWHRVEHPCGTIRHRLYVNGKETPFFIDNARKAGKAHWNAGDPVGLYGSGMGAEVRTRGGGSYRIARLLLSAKNVGIAKARAEVLSLN